MQKQKYTCTKCDFEGRTKVEVIKHVNVKHGDQIKEKEFNCGDCDFQGTSADQLRKHVNLKHSLPGQENKGHIQCKICGESFIEKWNLMKHRKNQHISFVAPCRNEMDGKCSYTADMCWWNHNKTQNYQNKNIKCFLCSETFQSKADMMIHRKKSHAGFVKKCLKYAQNECHFKKHSCWYLHEEEMETDDNEEKGDESMCDREKVEVVFHKVSENLKPPIRLQKKQKID